MTARGREGERERESSRRLLAVLALLLSFSGNAFAGYYEVNYQSSGIAHRQNTAISEDLPYGVQSGGVTSGQVAISGDFPSIQCSGSVQATFTWVPSNPSDQPPHTAILREYAYVSWGGPSGPFLDGGGDDGFGDLAYDQGTGSGMASRIKYTVIQEPGDSFTAPAISPEVHVSNNEGRITASVAYAAGLYAVWIDTSYTVNAEGDIFAEAGRPLIAAISCALPGVHFANYSWSATGRIFKAYNPSTISTHVEWMSPVVCPQVELRS